MTKTQHTDVFISYAREDATPAGKKRKHMLEELLRTLKSYGFRPVYDRGGGVAYNESITEFMKRIGLGNYVILLISDKFLKSKFCMQEAINVLNSVQDYSKRLFPIVMEDAAIIDASSRDHYITYWANKEEELRAKLKNSTPGHAPSLQEELDITRKINAGIREFFAHLSDIDTLDEKSHLQNNFQELIKKLIQQMLENWGYPSDEAMIGYFVRLQTTPAASANELQKRYERRRRNLIKSRDHIRGESGKVRYTQQLKKLKEAHKTMMKHKKQDRRIQKSVAWIVLMAIPVAAAYFWLTPAQVVLTTNKPAFLQWNGSDSVKLTPGKPLRMELSQGNYLFKATREHFRDQKNYRNLHIGLFTLKEHLTFNFSHKPIPPDIEKSQEEKEFKKAMASEDPEKLRAFIRKYSESPRSDRARELLHTIEAEDVSPERRKFEIAKNHGTIEALRHYLSSYPDSKYKKQAHHLLQRKLKSRRQQKDSLWFASALDQDDTASYKNYLKTFPNGLFADSARERLKALRDMFSEKVMHEAYKTARILNTIAAYRVFTKKYPNSHYTEKLNASIDSLRNLLTSQGMAYIPGGVFYFGPDEKRVQITGFFIERKEVTVDAYRNYCQSANTRMPPEPNSYERRPNKPIVNVTHKEASQFAKANHKQLPTEAQWEYAARNYINTFNTKDPRAFAWLKENNKGGPHPVNDWNMGNRGISNMLGNVWEWCHDNYTDNLQIKEGTINPKGPKTGSFKVIKGGSFKTNHERAEIQLRKGLHPDTRNESLGFRCVRTKIRIP